MDSLSIPNSLTMETNAMALSSLISDLAYVQQAVAGIELGLAQDVTGQDEDHRVKMRRA